jgi:uncharacterized membrane protein YphA (DoxX/SURF4 family)
MAPELQPEPSLVGEEPARWGLPLPVVFRFVFLYFGMIILSGPILGGLLPFAGWDIPNLAELPPFRSPVNWAAAHVFHLATPLAYASTGSGDRAFDWVLAFCVMVLAAAGTAVWSAVDPKRPDYRSLHKWYHLGLRLAVGSQFLVYGFSKVIPMQMRFPPLSKLVEPFGNFSPASVLWFSVGASPAYERFTGAEEVFGAVLLFFPRTATFGALVCLADATEVFVLNMAYDIPVKLHSFHLVAMSAVLLAPELRRLMSFFFTGRATAPSARPQLFRTPRANRIALALQAVYLVALVVANLVEVQGYWRQAGPDAPKSPLYGIWNVDRDSPESKLWRRVLFDMPAQASLQHADDSLEAFVAAVDTKAGTVMLTKAGTPNWKASFQFQRAGPDRMTLDGQMNGAPLHLKLRLQDRNKLLLISRGFNWVQERPFYR